MLQTMQSVFQATEFMLQATESMPQVMKSMLQTLESMLLLCCFLVKRSAQMSGRFFLALA